MTEKRKPWAKWYWGDWRADPKLRLCNLQARGLWAEMIALMQEAQPYGHLLVEGIAPTTEELATLAGAPVKVVAQALADLERRGVFSRTPDGVIYSRRMVRDRAKEIQDQANGKGGGNPNLKNGDKGGVNPPDKPQDNTPDKAQRLDARDQRPERKKHGPRGPEFAEWYAVYPLKKAPDKAEKAYAAAIRRGATHEQLLAAAKRYAGEVKGTEARYIAHPATWLNDGRWADEGLVTAKPESPIDIRQARADRIAWALSKGIVNNLDATPAEIADLVRAGRVTEDQARKAGWAA